MVELFCFAGGLQQVLRLRRQVGVREDDLRLFIIHAYDEYAYWIAVACCHGMLLSYRLYCYTAILCNAL